MSKLLAAGAILGLVMASSVLAKAPGYYEQSSGGTVVEPRSDGYFFYKDPPESLPEEKIETPPDSAPPPTPPKAEAKKFDGYIPWDEVYTMHPDAFQALMDDSVKFAIQNPGDQARVDAYVTLQMVAIDRAERFQEAWQRTKNSLPMLDTTTQRPASKAASIVEVQSKQADVAQYINQMRQDMGLILFTKGGCPYCEEQKRILESFVAAWRWENIQEIDITQFPDAAMEYGVSIVPDLYLVGNLGDEVKRRRLRAGLTTRNEIEVGMLEAYSQWFLGRPYISSPQLDGQQAFQLHYKRLANGTRSERQPAQEAPARKPGGGMEMFLEKYQSQRKKRSTF